MLLGFVLSLEIPQMWNYLTHAVNKIKYIKIYNLMINDVFVIMKKTLNQLISVIYTLYEKIKIRTFLLCLSL